MGISGVRAWRPCMMCLLAARSAAVTGESSALVITSGSWRHQGRAISPASRASWHRASTAKGRVIDSALHVVPAGRAPDRGRPGRGLGKAGTAHETAEVVEVDTVDPDGFRLVARQALLVQVPGQYHGNALAHVAR